LQVDNHCPNAPFPVALCPAEGQQNASSLCDTDIEHQPFLDIRLTFAPKHTSGISCLRRVTVAPRDVAVAIDLAFIMRLQRFLIGIQEYRERSMGESSNSSSRAVSRGTLILPDLVQIFEERNGSAAAGVGSQNFYFQGLSILPCNITLSVAPALALTSAQASLEGKDAAAIHAAVRKGDVLIGDGSVMLGVKIGGENRSALAVIRGVFKSILVDALLRCDGATLNFDGIVLRNHTSTGPQLGTYLGAHYLASLRNNVPALLGSLAFFGNPVGLMRGLGDGMSDFVSEPVKGLKRSVEELDPSFVVDGVARGTGSLARHAVGGIADSASLLTETFSKNMAVLTLDRRYAQQRDRGTSLRSAGRGTTTFVDGVESGVVKLIRGITEGVTGVVKAPMRGAEKRGMEGFAKGVGKGLLGLLVKPMIGLSDAATDVMIGVKGSVEGSVGNSASYRGLHGNQIRPRRAFYGRDRAMREYRLADATATSIAMRTRLAGEPYLSHCDMGDSVALLSVKRLLVLGSEGEEVLVVKLKRIKDVEVRQNPKQKGLLDWGVFLSLKEPRKNGREAEVISCQEQSIALELCAQTKRAINLVQNESS